ncbi:PilW family protein [Stenoxybacter acetivorans]|uniref:PilW family protein n=1 Tax=Stenoxybacter acetivorans TaxID=422441 RepID=UPI0005609AB3|nr:prepilin-type N-terminal cleavage/methylation domain-containing protein [Stenoxybacter acetivorans]
MPTHIYQPKPLSWHKSHKQSGFSLIEFMVASAIGIIVLLAVGTTYITTQNLSTQGQSRIAVQQDLRNATNMLARDARAAGVFGCYNLAAEGPRNPGNSVTGNHTTAGANDPSEVGTATTHDNGNNFGIRQMNGSTFLGQTGVTLNNPSNALIFTYGVGFGRLQGVNEVVFDDGIGIAENTPVAVSTCSELVISTIDKDGKILNVGGISPSSRTTVTRFASSAYVVGDDARGAPSLYRFTLGNNNQWEGPQLLVSNVQAFGPIQYGYADISANDDGAGCNINTGLGGTDNFNAGTTSFTFYTDTLSYNPPTLASPLDQALLPALIHIPLGVTVDTQNINYAIDIAVRGGNVCANRVLARTPP